MAVTGDVVTGPAGSAGVPYSRLQPYILTLVKWCASCLWGAAAVLLRRLLELPPAVPPLPPIPIPPVAALVRSTLQLRARRRVPRAPAPHISHAATVECEVLHAPEAAAGGAGVDVIFVHGLYGSLANTWRQGQWRSKHKCELNKIPLKRHTSTPETPCTCRQKNIHFPEQKKPRNEETCLCKDEDDDTVDVKDNTRNHRDNLKHQNDVDDNGLRNEVKEGRDREFYLERKKSVMEDLMDDKIEDISDRKNVQKENTNMIDEHYYNYKENENYVIENVKIVDSYTDFMKDIFTNDAANYDIDFDSGCDVEVFSSYNEDGTKFCDNSKDINNEDIPEKDDRYDDFAETFSDDHSKDGSDVDEMENCTKCTRLANDTNPSDITEFTNETNKTNKNCQVGCGCVCSRCYSSCWPKDWLQVDYPDARIISINYTSDPYLWRPIWIQESKRLRLHERADQMAEQLLALGVGSRPIVWVGHSKGGLFIKQIYCEGYEEFTNNNESMASGKSLLWSRTAGFMFYSVPHRGSPLADINIPPFVSRSIELLEMGKDCSGVLALQERWMRAVDGAGAAACEGGRARAPVVRSLVETRRTLMAVLWLRIVSVESADAGIGALCGVSVDHREICKPSSRRCLLYQELLHVIDSALARERQRDQPLCSCHQ